MEILFNKMYTGSFNEENIGHEIINFFKADNGKQYIYVSPYGGMDKKHDNKIKYILLIGPITNNKCEILAKAEVVRQIHFGGNQGTKEFHQKQLEIIKRENIKYGGVYLNEIMNDNYGNEQAIYVTFEVKNITKPKEQLFIIAGQDNSKIIGNSVFIKHKLSRSKGYVSSDGEYRSDYQLIEKLINDKTYWNLKDVSEEVDLSKYNINNTDFNFLKLINKENDELVFSNLLYYYFKEKKLFNIFAKKYLDINDDFKVLEKEKMAFINPNEKGRIDLWARGDNNIIIIENKIKSGLNRVDRDNSLSQLNVYINYALKNYQNKNIYCFVFAPNYNKEEIKKEKELYAKNIDFKVIFYSELYKFFNSLKEEFENDLYYNDFLSGLLKHTLEASEEMERKFANAIYRIKNKDA